jgi:CheY-like chemotaxis protein
MARILVADDEPAMREMMVLACRMDGHEVAEAVDAPSAVGAYEARRPDLLVVDLSMPGGGGAEAVRRIRARAGGACCPVIVVSGFLDSLSDGERAELDATAVLEKPFTIESLRAAIRRSLGGT